MTIEQLYAQPLEKRLQHTGQITYDLEALRAVNRQYVHELAPEALHRHLTQYLAVNCLDQVDAPVQLIGALQKEVNNVAQLHDLVVRITQVPLRPREQLVAHCGDEATVKKVLEKAQALFACSDGSAGLQELKAWAKEEGLGMKVVLGTVRYAATGLLTGIGMGTLVSVMPATEIAKRIKSLWS